MRKKNIALVAHDNMKLDMVEWVRWNKEILAQHMLIFFWDPMEQQPHDVDVKALLRIAVLYNIPTASNRTSADYLISSPLFEQDYRAPQKDYLGYIKRTLDHL